MTNKKIPWIQNRGAANPFLEDYTNLKLSIKYTPDKGIATTFKVKKVKTLSHDKLRNESILNRCVFAEQFKIVMKS